MNLIAAACAMQWNVELDAGLRSQKPGSQWEAILKLGTRLQQWSKEPPVSAITASLFKLAPGQERAFTNAIMMHLSEAFRSGNNFTRFCTLKILFLERKSRRNRNLRTIEKGLIRKDRIPNHVEILKRVKSVAGSGDHIARALAWWVIGCLAELVGDSIDAYRLLLEALGSQYEHEVHAALFALGCFCEVSEHLCSLAVDDVYKLATAKETSAKTRILAISVFSQMHSSVLVALKAHETGKAVMLSIMEKDVVVATLVALSKLALKSSILVPVQADLLLSHMYSDPHVIVRAISLKCLTKLAAKAKGRTGIEAKAIGNLLPIIESADQPPIMKDLALKVLRKLVPFCLVAFDANHLVSLMSMFDLSASNPSQVQLILGFQVDLVCCMGKLRPDVLEAADVQMRLKAQASPLILDNDEPFSGLDIISHVTVLACDQLALLGCKNGFEGLKLECPREISEGGHALSGSELRRRCLFLGRLLLQLARYSPYCCFVVVDRLSGMVEAFLTKLQQLGNGHTSADNVMTETRDWDKGNLHALSSTRSCFLRMVCYCLRRCGLIWLSEEEHSSNILLRLSKLIALIMAADFSHHILKDFLSLLLELKVFLSPQQAGAIAMKVNDAAISFVKEADHWSAYKVVTLAACHGIWDGSSEAIESITQKTQSEGTYFWLRALAAVCRFEGILQGECEGWSRTIDKDIQRTEGNSADIQIKVKIHSDMSGKLGKTIAMALSGVHSAENSLAAAAKLERTFDFQRRLLGLRIAFVQATGELLGLLQPICADGQAFPNLMASVEDDLRKHWVSRVQAVATKSGLFCTKFRKLAAAFDLLRVSFMGIDAESANVLSSASLGCSLISFCLLCALSIPQVLGNGNTLNPSLQCLAVSVSNDLYQRLDTSRGDEWSDLYAYLLQLGGAKESARIAGGRSCVDNLEKGACKFISKAVREVLDLQEDMNMRHSELKWVILAKGMYVCKKVAEKWLRLPWVLPKHFFCTRPPVIMDLFVELMSDTPMGKEKQLAQGLLALLSICFQIRNLGINGGKRVKKLCGAVILKSAEPEHVDEISMCSDRELFLLEKLFEGVSLSKEMRCEEAMQESVSGKVRRDLPPRILCSVDERGQGFGSCLLDTSKLKCGVFRVSVLAVCLDQERCCWIVPQCGVGPTLRIVPSTSG